MIIKYRALNGGWGFIDNISAVVNQQYSSDAIARSVRKEINEGKREEHTESSYESTTYIHNDIFVGLSEIVNEEVEGDYTILSILHEQFLPNDSYDNEVSIVVCNNKWRDEFDKIILFTNTACYLLNDKGETIERLN